ISRRAAMPRREQPIVAPAHLVSPPPLSRPATARFSNGSRPTCGKRPRQEVDMSNVPASPGRKFTVIAMLVAAVMLTAAPALVHGVWSRRWRDPADMAKAARSVEDFPRQFGDWKQHGDDETMPEEAVRELRCAGYINRHYVNQKLGREVTVLLMVGPSGPLVRHPPEICYGNQANELLQKPANMAGASPDSQNHTFRFLRYKNPGAASGE